jgi:hypothetical protein
MMLMSLSADYDPRYLAGVSLFNQGDYFEAHEVWEELWHVSTPPERRFYQGLIQAAVALCHYHNGNLRGAAKLYHSSRDYLEPYRPAYLGLNVDRFWDAMRECFAPVLVEAPSAAMESLPRPHIALDPPPVEWPDPNEFLPKDTT